MRRHQLVPILFEFLKAHQLHMLDFEPILQWILLVDLKLQGYPAFQPVFSTVADTLHVFSEIFAFMVRPNTLLPLAEPFPPRQQSLEYGIPGAWNRFEVAYYLLVSLRYVSIPEMTSTVGGGSLSSFFRRAVESVDAVIEPPICPAPCKG